MNYKKIIFFILFICSCFSINAALAIKPNQPEITNMIFFGDSLTDVGNNTWILINGIFGAPITNPNDQSLKYIWPNYLVRKKLNKPVYPSSQPNISPFSDNISYAYAGAETGEQYNNTNWPPNTQVPTNNPDCTQPGSIQDSTGNIKSTCNPGLLQQVDLYLQDTHFMPNPKTLFFIWAGANDIFDYYNTNAKQYISMTLLTSPYSDILGKPPPIPSEDDLSALEQRVIHNINEAKKKLIDAGVKPEMIYILTLPDLSAAPALRTSNNWKLTIFFNKENLEKSLSATSQSLNQKLQTQQDDPKYAIPPSNYLQIGDKFLDMRLNPTQYNVIDVENNCVEKKAMPVCPGYLFYDQKHPTTTIHNIIADFILQKLDNI